MAPSAIPVNGDGSEPHQTQSEFETNGGNSNGVPNPNGQANGNGVPNTNEGNTETPAAMEIAIVGMGTSTWPFRKPEFEADLVLGVRLPGSVTSPDEFWELCSRARSGWSPIPKERFNHETFHHPNPDKIGCYNPRGGHFLSEDVGLFDAPFFNLTEKEAISLDPQQRLLLECTYEALENGGITKKNIEGQSVGVYVGGSKNAAFLSNPKHSCPGYEDDRLSNIVSQVTFSEQIEANFH